jgi:shikimate dehydrogenase
MSRFALIGHPVAHSLSPAIHRAAYRALELDHDYELVDAPDEDAARAAVERVRRGEVAGANVTLPYKRLALELAGRADEHASEIGAANVIARAPDRVLVARNTDVPALAAELQARAAGARVAAVIGAGGAALAAVAACHAIGVTSVGVVARRWQGGVDPANWPGAARFRELGATVVAWPAAPASAREERANVADSAWEALVVSSQIIVQASSAGMLGGEPGESVRDVVPWLRLGRDVLAYDVVYNPPVTPFSEAARAAGLASEGGLGVLVEQAALALELWLGVAAPRAEMRRAAEHALAGKS